MASGFLITYQQSNQPQAAKETTIAYLKVYPNPAMTYTTFQWDFETFDTAAQLLIYNAGGHLIGSKNIHDPLGQWVLDTRQLPAGVYLYSLIRDEIQLAGGSFIVRK